MKKSFASASNRVPKDLSRASIPQKRPSRASADGLPTRRSYSNLAMEVWMQVAELLTPADFLSLSNTSRTLQELQKNTSITRRVAQNSQLTPPKHLEVGSVATRISSDALATLRAESLVVSRLKHGPVVLDMFDDITSMWTAPSNLHVVLHQPSKKQYIVVPLYAPSQAASVFPVEEHGNLLCGSMTFEFIVQHSAEGPVWLHDLQEGDRPRKCIAPFAMHESLDVAAIPQRSAYWVSYKTARRLRLFEQNDAGTFFASREVSLDIPVGLLQSSRTGDRLVWQNELYDFLQVVQLDASGSWKSLLDVDNSGCGCESIVMSNSGNVAIAKPCSEYHLVALAPQVNSIPDPYCHSLNLDTVWEGPDEPSLFIPSADMYYSFTLPRLNRSGPLAEDELPTWMQAHLAWQRKGPQVEACLLKDHQLLRKIPVVVDTNRHCPIDYKYKKFRFFENITLFGINVRKGDLAVIRDFSFDTSRRLVLVKLLFERTHRVICVPAVSFITKAEPVVRKDD